MTIIRCGAFVAALGLACGTVAVVHAGSPEVLSVDSVTGSARPSAGASVAYTVVVRNPNDDFDDGMQSLIMFDGSLRPTGTITSANGVACTTEPASATNNGGYRCFAASLAGGATTTLIAWAQADRATTGRVDVDAWQMSDHADDQPKKSLSIAATDPGMTAPVLRRGANGSAVRTMQQLLNHHGVDVTVDGDFGEQTERAVRELQMLKQLGVDGVVGERTWAALFVTVRLNDQGDLVRIVQEQLAADNPDVAVDGEFGPQTERAVRDFQKAKGLSQDGIVGPRTWAALVALG